MDLGSSTFVRNVDIPHTDLETSVVFLSLRDGKYLSLDGTARSVWSLLEEPKTLAGLVKALADRYQISEDACLADTLPFLERLIERGLVKVLSGSRS